jgi:hypothetical protein
MFSSLFKSSLAVAVKPFSSVTTTYNSFSFLARARESKLSAVLGRIFSFSDSPVDLVSSKSEIETT